MLRKLIAVFLLATSFQVAAAQTCADNNYIVSYPPWDPVNGLYHLTGYHYWLTNAASTCSYSSVGAANCETLCHTYGSVYGNDTGLIWNPLNSHHAGGQTNGGYGAGLGQVSCGATAAIVATSCLILSSCAAVVSFSGGYNGIVVSVSFPPSAIYALQTSYSNICEAEPDPSWDSGGSGFGGGDSCGPDGCSCGDGTCGVGCCSYSPNKQQLPNGELKGDHQLRGDQ